MRMTDCFVDGVIDQVLVYPLVVHTDPRGSLVEAFRADTLPAGLRPCMGYVSVTGPGIARGPHEHREQTDIFVFTGPGTFTIMLWDNRAGSRTRGVRMVLRAGAQDPSCVIVPPGVVHAYRNLSERDPGMVLNFPNQLYGGWGRGGAVDEIRHEARADLFYEDMVKR